MKRRSGYDDERIPEIYDALPGCHGRPDVGFYLRTAPREGRVLDLGCGTGRILMPLARRGLEVLGLDLSSDMVTRCRAKLIEEPPAVQERVDLVCGDMRAFELGEHFDLVIIPFGGFHHLRTRDDQLACLSCCERHLRAGGQLIIDLFATEPEWLRGQPAARDFERLDDVPLRDGRRFGLRLDVVCYHPEEQFNEILATYDISNGDSESVRIVQRYPHRYFSVPELEDLVASSGLVFDELRGGYEPVAPPLTGHSSQMIVMARKARAS